MRAQKFRRFGVIEKVVQNDDGTLNVYGIASTEERDGDDEVILASAMKEALPDYMKWGAIREMHQPKAAGTAIEAEVNDDTGQTWIGVHVVDREAVKKVKANVYKGFSVGGSVLERDADDDRTITKLKWIETSLVDRPSNPGAEILIVKAEKSGADQLDLAAGAAKGDTPKEGENKYGDVEFADEKNKKYPIDTEAHIRSAWSYINKEKNAAKYDEKQVAAIKAKIVAAWKAKIDKAGPPGAEKLAKGMWDVAQLATMLAGIRDLAASAEWESIWENDGSPMPQELRDWLETGAGVLKDMADEEIAELIESLKPVAAGAAETAFMRIAKMKPAHVEKLMKISDKIHDHADKCAKMAGDLNEHAGSMDKVLADHNGDDMDDKQKADLAAHLKKYSASDKGTGGADDIAKKLADKESELAKVAGERDAAIDKAAKAEAKAAELEEGLATVKTEVSTMVEQMKAKGIVRVVSKVDDGKVTDPAAANEPKPVNINGMSPEEAHAAVTKGSAVNTSGHAHDEVRKIHAGGGAAGWGRDTPAKR